MKNHLFILLFLMLFSGTLSAQSIYLRAGTGYGLPIAPAILGENYLQTSSINDETYSYESVKGSYGSGGTFNVAFGYELNKNLIIEINTQYLISNKYKTSDNYIGTGTSYVDMDETKTSARGLFINPSVIFSAGFGKAAPYARFGFILGSPKVLGSQSLFYNGDGTDSTNIKWEYSKGVAFGFQGAVGMNWKLSEKLDLFTELNFVSMTYYAGEYNVTKYNTNGNDYLPNLNQSMIKTIYEKKYSYLNSNYDPNKPTIALRESTPFSSLSLQVGIRFTLWTKADEIF